MKEKNQRVFIVNAKRTAIGKFLGSLYEADPAEVCAQLIRQGFEEEKAYFKDIENVIIGNVISAGTGQVSIPVHFPSPVRR